MAASSLTQNNANYIYFDHITCSVCLEVLQDPVQCVKNEHHFCKKCITMHLERSKTCPVCQDTLTSETLRPSSRIVANLLQQVQSPKCRYTSRGCTADVTHKSLFSHQEECGFAPVQCSHKGCNATVSRQDVDSHVQKCEFRSLTCDDCHEVMRQREYRKHTCILRKEVDENRANLAELKKILREIQDEQLRQGVEIKRYVSTDLGQTPETQQRKGDNLKQPSSDKKQSRTSQEQRSNLSKVASASSNQSRTASSSSNPIQSQTAVKRKIVVAGDTEYEVFDWSTQKWSLYENTLFFNHSDAFSFVYDNNIMICSGKGTNRIDFLNVPNDSSIVYPSLLPSDCGKGVLVDDTILTFGQAVSATSLKPPFKTTVHVPYKDGRKLLSYAVIRMNENAVVVLGGNKKFPSGRYKFDYREESKQNVSVYNPATKAVTKLAPLPYGMTDMAVVAHDDYIIILGGRKNENICNDVLMYNMANQTCSKLPSMVEERSNCAAVIMGDTIVAIGGEQKASERSIFPTCLRTAEYLVLGEKKWRTLPEMHFAKSRVAACLLP